MSKENTKLEEVKITGTVKKVFFEDKSTQFKIARIDSDEVGYVSVKGIMPFAEEGSSVIVTGVWENNDKYGMQIAVQTCIENLPTDAIAIKDYLSSHYVNGIGPKYAQAIVDYFGAETFDVLDKDPDRLLEVNGIGRVRLEKIKKGWRDASRSRELTMFLQAHGISPAFLGKIYATYGEKAEDVITENPYRLADDIDGIGFQRADEIASTFNIPKTSPVRIRNGILYSLKEFSQEGHCYAEHDKLVSRAASYLDVKSDLVEKELAETRSVKKDGENYYLPWLYAAEVGCAIRIAEILSEKKSFSISITGALSATSGVVYGDEQLNAISTALTNKISIMTGGPGTGKTTVIAGILAALKKARAKVRLAAPTGRAAKRMSEKCGENAMTIHRLLKYTPDGGFSVNENNPLKGDVLIVDECSMIDIQLMYNLLKAVPDHMTLILVGDVDQLPSVGPGNVLKDLIWSETIPTTWLTHIYRQGENSGISLNAAKINRGETPDFSGNEDFVFIEKDNDADIAKTVLDLYENYYVEGRDVQILSPQKKGAAGTFSLNKEAQARVNKNKESFRGTGGALYKKNDRVIQTKNDYSRDVFNGDIGKISYIDEMFDEFGVEFDRREATFDIGDTDNLSLAYAITVHKSQGSEYEYVIMPITTSHYALLQRNLVYTAVTRAERKMIIVGTKKALMIAIRNNKAKKRNSALARRLNYYVE